MFSYRIVVRDDQEIHAVLKQGTHDGNRKDANHLTNRHFGFTERFASPLVNRGVRQRQYMLQVGRPVNNRGSEQILDWYDVKPLTPVWSRRDPDPSGEGDDC